MNKLFLFFIFSVSVFGQEYDSVVVDSNSIEIIKEVAEQDTTKSDLPDIRALKQKVDQLGTGSQFFELQSSIDRLNQQMDSLKNVISIYEEGKGAVPNIDEELLNLIKVPQLRHRIELQNGTIINGEIIDEDDLGIIIQTSIGQLMIEKDRVLKIAEDLPPNAKIEFISEPFVSAFPDREEITGTIKNVGSKRADFVRVIASLWSPTTELIRRDSVFVNGQSQKYFTGISSDTALDPGTTGEFKMVIPLSEGEDVSYRTYQLRWESYK